MKKPENSVSLEAALGRIAMLADEAFGNWSHTTTELNRYGLTVTVKMLPKDSHWGKEEAKMCLRTQTDYDSGDTWVTEYEISNSSTGRSAQMAGIHGKILIGLASIGEGLEELGVPSGMSVYIKERAEKEANKKA